MHATGGEVGDAIVENPDIGVISFTGSSTTGKSIALRAGERLKRVSLELGSRGTARFETLAAIHGFAGDDIGLYSRDGADCSSEPSSCLPLPVDPERFALEAPPTEPPTGGG